MVGGADLVCVLVPTHFSPPASYEYHPHVDTATGCEGDHEAFSVILKPSGTGLKLVRHRVSCARLAGDGHVNTICRGMNH